MKDLVLMDINCKDARSFRLVTGKLFSKIFAEDKNHFAQGFFATGMKKSMYSLYLLSQL